ncbi:MAG: hypothetical protein CMI58_01960 [Parcubacteria group bacterium]|jgi:ParB family chromosome partitioning protein|nr:hypothetical protein [Parcubacteria group bacterium]
MSYIQNNSIFWVEVDKVRPNPYQPRRDFDESKLNDLAESIKMYGLLQPLVVTRQEEEKEDGGLLTTYELISGERRLRASRIAGLVQIPVIIRSGEEDNKIKLELAIIENLQREDLNPVERARAFHQLAEEFGFKHSEIAKKVGKSREFVSNTIRILALPDDVLGALSSGKISEGHARPILMLKDKPQEQVTLFKEVMYKKLTVRESEAIARRIAYDKVRKQSRTFDPELVEMEDQLAESLGTRVFIEKRPVGGKVMIDFFSNEDLRKILNLLQSEKISLTDLDEIGNSSQGHNKVNEDDSEFLNNLAEVKNDDNNENSNNNNEEKDEKEERESKDEANEDKIDEAINSLNLSHNLDISTPSYLDESSKASDNSDEYSSGKQPEDEGNKPHSVSDFTI